MAAVMHPQSPPSTSPPNELPPLPNTSRSTSYTQAQRPLSYASHRLSRFSTTSSAARSRPGSTVLPLFQSSLSYALVRDFAYPALHPLHYGPQPTKEESVHGEEEIQSPVSEGGRRLSDPPVRWWGRSSPESEETEEREGRLRLEPRSYGQQDGPPYLEDPDLHSPIITSTSRRSGGRDNEWARRQSGPRARDSDHRTESGSHEYITYPPGGRRPSYDGDETPHPLTTSTLPPSAYQSRKDDPQFLDDDEDPSRFSRAWEFTISHPDESFAGRAIALFDFVSENSNELGLVEGQVILVSYRHGQGWLVAQDPKTGESGLVPEEYVRLEREIDMESWERDNAEEDDSSNDENIGHVVVDDEDDDTTKEASTENGLRIDSGQAGLSGAKERPRNSKEISIDEDDVKTPTGRHASSHSGQWYEAVQSRFQTSSKDLEPRPREQVHAERRGSGHPPVVGRRESNCESPEKR